MQKKSWAALFLCGIAASSIAQNFKDDYKTITIEGAVTASLLKSPNSAGFSKTAKEMGFESKKIATLEKEIGKERNEMLINGFVYFNDAVSQYVNSVLDKTLASEPGLRGKVKVYVTRYSSVNAISLPEGTIFLNIGLLAALENESQLAGVLAHEVAHIKKQHVLNNRKKIEKIKKEEENVYNPDGNVFRNLSFSRDNEFEADAVGLSIMTGSDYDASEMGRSLELLEFTDTNETTFNLEKLFTNEYFKVDTAEISKKKIKSWLKGERNNDDNATLLGLVEDIYLTHPEIEKRVLALKEILKSTSYKFAGKKNEGEFLKIKTTAKFELMNNCLKTGNYVRSAYEAIRLLKDYPDNKFVNLCLMRSLYWLSHLREQDLLDKAIEKSVHIPTKNFAMLNLLLKKPDISEYKKLMYGYIKLQEDKLKTNEEYLLQLAMATEAYLGKEAAGVFYRQFAAKFPSSNYATFIEEKLK